MRTLTLVTFALWCGAILTTSVVLAGAPGGVLALAAATITARVLS